MNIKLTRPLAVLDLETTGIIVTTDRIIEIAIIKVMPDGTQQKKRKILNPTIPIPQASSDVHGFTDADVQACPTFKDAANEIKQFIENCDLAGYNSNRFDIPILAEEFLRVGLDLNLADRKMLDAAQIFMKKEQRTLTAAYKFYCGKDLENAHSAEADAMATFEILDAQIAHYEDLPNDINELHNFCKGEDFADLSRRIKIVNGKNIFNFGKYKEQEVEEVFNKDKHYYDWIMKSDFALDTKNVVSTIYNKMKLGK